MPRHSRHAPFFSQPLPSMLSISQTTHVSKVWSWCSSSASCSPTCFLYPRLQTRGGADTAVLYQSGISPSQEEFLGSRLSWLYSCCELPKRHEAGTIGTNNVGFFTPQSRLLLFQIKTKREQSNPSRSGPQLVSIGDTSLTSSNGQNYTDLYRLRVWPSVRMWVSERPLTLSVMFHIWNVTQKMAAALHESERLCLKEQYVEDGITAPPFPDIAVITTKPTKILN